MTGKLGIQGSAHPFREEEYSLSTVKVANKLCVSPVLDATMANGTCVMTQGTTGDGLKNLGVLDKKNEEEVRVFPLGKKKVDEVCLLSKADMLKLEEWNRVVPEKVDRCVHELITEWCRAQPDAPAVCAWDGNFTYAELDALSSALAARLTERGVGPEVFVPLCFEKSRWTTVAMVAVMKAGGAFMLLDPSQPLLRLKELCAAVKATLVLSSPTNESRSKELADTVVVLSSTVGIFSSCDLHDYRATTLAQPHHAIYASFTSGSTGIPKVVVVEHSAYCTNALAHSNAAQLNKDSRVLQLASYAFAVGIVQMVTTLMVGGCVCVPSDSDCRDNIAAAVRRFRANWAAFTPSVLRKVRHDDMSNLKNVILSGETPVRNDITAWPDHVQVTIAYGSAETVCCAATQNMGTLSSPQLIGKMTGSVGWVVEPDNHHKLVPLGAVGELLVEGPILARGYLNDAKKTTEAFIEAPNWFSAFCERYSKPSRRDGRMYKTGDLVQFHVDGSLTLVGRKDTQVKIRGQRVELGEVEHHVQQSLVGDTSPLVVAEVVTPRGSNHPMLMAYLAIGEGANESPERVRATLDRWTEGVEERLMEQVPRYMVPSAYLAVDTIPMTATGKTDRRRLREMGRALTLEQVIEMQPCRGALREPATGMEKRLQGLWVHVLNLPADRVRADDSFFRLGGDSIAAVHLVAAAREEGLSLSVADVLNTPRLSQMAHVVKAESYVEETPVPFSLLQPRIDVGFARAQAAAQCGVDTDLVDDVFPCTPLQEGMLAMTAKRPGAYASQILFQIRIDIETERLKQSWREVVATMPILRTRIVNLEGQGLVQVVIAEQGSFTACEDLGTYLKADKQEPMGLGAPLTRFAIMHTCSDQRLLVWTVHHALFDGWTMPLVLKQVEQAYYGHTRDHLVPFQGFIKHILQSSGGTCEYWQGQLGGSEAVPFPSLPSPDYHPQADDALQHPITGLQWPRSDITASTTVRAAWAILQGQYTNSSDVIFGATVTGRQVPVPGVERMAGPTIATVPIRVKLNWEMGVLDLLRQVQTQAVGMMQYEQTGLQHIRRIRPDIEQASQFQTLVVVQPAARDNDPESNKLFRARNDAGKDSDGGLNAFNTYAILAECQLGAEGIKLRISFDSQVVERLQVQRMAQQLEHVLRQMCAESSPPLMVKDMCGVSQEDLRQLAQWNGSVPARVDRCVHTLVEERCRVQPAAPAVCAWDGDFTYGELDALSSTLAAHLAERGVGPEVFVPLCFEKSRWTTVAMFGVMKAGGAFVLLDPSHPWARLEAVCRTISAPLVVSSAANRALAAELAAAVVVVGDDVPAWRSPTQTWTGSAVAPDNALYAVFTSGSTGSPKGVVVHHAAFCSSARAHSTRLGVTSQSRILQFASYSFDVSISDTLTTLLTGACICVPSANECNSDLSQTLHTYRSNWTHLTPSVGRLLLLQTRSELQVLALIGEPMTRADIQKWSSRVRLINSYGPAECSVISTLRTDIKAGSDPQNIGYGAGCVCWVVDPADHERLVPIGAVGELLIEGPIVGRGYLNDPQRTAAAFVAPPAWLQQFRSGSSIGRLYKTGDLVQYATDGSLRFVERKDTQVKLRGQRIELGEVEHHTRRSFPGAREVVADVVTPVEAGRAPMLVAFVSVDNQTKEDKCNEDDRADDINDILAAPTDAFHAAVLAAEFTLHDSVPAYMVPAVFLPLVAVPLTANGKTDRSRLRDRAATLTRAGTQAYCSPTPTKRRPTTAAERTLQQLWAQVLQITPDSIGADDSFFRLGGDSISAMHLAILARSQGLDLSVSYIFALRQLSTLAAVLVKSENVEASTNVKPFSLLDPQQKSVLLNSRPRTLTNDTKLDIMPVTNSQFFFLTQWSLSCLSFSIQGIVDLDRLRLACHSIVQTHSIMRTVFIKNQGKLFQVVLKSINVPLRYIHTKESLEPVWRSICKVDSNKDVLSGEPLVKFTLISRSETEHIFTVRLSHAQYDGSSRPIILRDLVTAYNQDIHSGPVCATFPDYVYFCASNRSKCAFNFWKDYLQGSVMTMLPCSDLQANQVSADIHEIAFGDLPSALEDITIPTLINAAFSFVLASLTKKDDVVFGVVTNTRAIPLPRVHTILGPCINHNPLRARLAQVWSVIDLCRLLRDQYAQSQQFCHIEFSDILAKSTDWPSDTKLGCILNHLGEGDNSSLPLKGGGIISDSFAMGRIDLQDQLLIRAIPGKGKLQVQVLTSNRIMDSEQAGLLAKSLIDTANAFAMSPEAPLSSMSFLHT